MNANFDSEETSERDGPTAHRHAYYYSIYLDTDSRCGVAQRRIGRAGTEDVSSVETRLAASPTDRASGDGASPVSTSETYESDCWTIPSPDIAVAARSRNPTDRGPAARDAVQRAGRGRCSRTRGIDVARFVRRNRRGRYRSAKPRRADGVLRRVVQSGGEFDCGELDVVGDCKRVPDREDRGRESLAAIGGSRERRRLRVSGSAIPDAGRVR